MATHRIPQLSKSRYQAGLQCPLRLWLGEHRPECGTPRSAGQLAILESGREVGEAARQLFPGGVLVEEGARAHESAVTRTLMLLGDLHVPAIFEAAFTHANVRIRVDVLERLGEGRFGLREVKSATRLKSSHPSDLAIQLWVLRGLGLDIASVELIHVDRGFERSSEPIDWKAFFARTDAAPRVEPLLCEIDDRVQQMNGTLSATDQPIVEPGSQCLNPYPCEFFAHCTADKTEEWFVSRKRVREELRLRWLESARTGEVWLSGNLPGALEQTRPPVWYLDFEALTPAAPLYKGTHPYQAIAFQWSLHRRDEDGRITHDQFLAEGDVDPRRATAESLLAALSGDDAPVIVYSSYEDRQLADMAAHAPDLADGLEALRSRLVDLLPILRAGIYHPRFRGSFSLKAVGPVLAPQVDYGDLDGVADGTAAARAFAQIASGRVGDDEAARLRGELLAYCKLDTRALMEVHRAIERRVAANVAKDTR
jgi:hypothetical protein